MRSGHPKRTVFCSVELCDLRPGETKSSGVKVKFSSDGGTEGKAAGGLSRSGRDGMVTLHSHKRPYIHPTTMYACKALSPYRIHRLPYMHNGGAPQRICSLIGQSVLSSFLTAAWRATG